MIGRIDEYHQQKNKDLMKVIVQNGAQHALSRRIVEAMLEHIPWQRGVENISLCSGEFLAASFHKKERSLSLIWPFREPHPEKAVAIELLVAALATIEINGDLPKRFSAPRVVASSKEISAICDKCFALLRAPVEAAG